MPRKFQSRHPRVRKTASTWSRKTGAFVLSGLVAVFFVGYLMQVNASASRSVKIRTLESQITDLKTQGDKLELKVAQEQSVASVERKVKEMGMVPTAEVHYVSVPAAGVAMR